MCVTRGGEDDTINWLSSVAMAAGHGEKGLWM